MDGYPVEERSFRTTIGGERGFTLIELLVVVVIIGVLAAIAIPTYVGQQDKAKDTAAQAQLRTAATAQQLFYAEADTYTNDVEELRAYGFRQGDQMVNVRSGDASSYCMDARGGGEKMFHITAEMGKPEEDECAGTQNNQ
ncbi:MAG: prepilin-type N-terminal cleavage/methylation domain-containing protein [Rubrobacter sp.]